MSRSMGDECRPPEGAEAGTWHWLDWRDEGPYPFQWMHGSWWSARSSMETDWAADRGYRYREPALTPDEAAGLRADLARLAAALKPFADEGQKWSGTNPCHDDLKLIVAEDWHMADRIAREAAFTIGDLKRAAVASAQEATDGN